MKNQEYYQIFERNHPVIDANFETKKQARNYLKKIAIEIDSSNKAPILFSYYERRLVHLPIRDILFLKKLYADGHEESVSLVIRHMKFVPQYNK